MQAVKTIVARLLSRRRISLTCTSLLDVILHQLWRMRLRATHDQVTGRPEIAGRIFLFHAREFDEDFLRRLLAHNAHEIARRCGWRHINDPLDIFRSYGEVFQTPGECDADLWQPFRD